MLAVHLYAGDHQERLVSSGLSHGGSTNEHAAWINTLKKHYGGNTLIARCPSDESIHWETPLTFGSTSSSDDRDEPNDDDRKEPILRRTSYGTNYYTVDKIGGRGPFNRIGMFRTPANTILMVELTEEGEFAASDHVHPEQWWSDPLRLAGDEVELVRHISKPNYSFMDGHVSPQVFKETYEIDVEGSMSSGELKWKHNLYDPMVAR